MMTRYWVWVWVASPGDLVRPDSGRIMDAVPLTETRYGGCRILMDERAMLAHERSQRRLDAEFAAEAQADNAYWERRAAAGLCYPCD